MIDWKIYEIVRFLQLNFLSLSLYKRDSLTNFRAQKAKENLRREKGAEEIRRAFEKTEGQWGKKVWRYFVSECD